MSKRLCTLLLIASLAGCCCPPANSSSGGRTQNGDPSSGTFAFFGGLRAFFGSDTSSEDSRRIDNTIPANDPKAKADDTDHAAALTIR